MTTKDLFSLADACVEAGFLPALSGRSYVLGLEVPVTKRAIIHRKEVSFRLFCSCRVWLMSGKVVVLLGDSHALPADLSSGTRPPWTG